MKVADSPVQATAAAEPKTPAVESGLEGRKIEIGSEAKTSYTTPDATIKSGFSDAPPSLSRLDRRISSRQVTTLPDPSADSSKTNKTPSALQAGVDRINLSDFAQAKLSLAAQEKSTKPKPDALNMDIGEKKPEPFSSTPITTQPVASPFPSEATQLTAPVAQVIGSDVRGSDVRGSVASVEPPSIFALSPAVIADTAALQSEVFSRVIRNISAENILSASNIDDLINSNEPTSVQSVGDRIARNIRPALTEIIATSGEFFTRNAESLGNKELIFVIQPSLQMTDPSPLDSIGHKVTAGQVVVVLDPNKLQEPTVQVVVRHEVAAGTSVIGDAHIPFGNETFTDVGMGLGGTLIAGDEIGVSFSVNLKSSDGSGASDGSGTPSSETDPTPLTKDHKLFTQSHIRAEVSVPYGPSRLQATVGSEQVHVKSYDLASATESRAKGIVKQVIGENIAGAAAAGLAFSATQSTSVAHLAGIAGKSIFRNAVHMSPPSERNVYHQNQLGPADLNAPFIGQEDWVPDEGTTRPSVGVTVNFYTRIQSSSANADNIESFHLLREEDLNSEIAASGMRTTVVDGKLDRSARSIELISTALAQTNEIAGKNKNEMQALTGFKENIDRLKDSIDSGVKQLSELSEQRSSARLDTTDQGDSNLHEIEASTTQVTERNLELAADLDNQRSHLLNDLGIDSDSKLDSEIQKLKLETNNLSTKLGKLNSLMESRMESHEILTNRKSDIKVGLDMLNKERQSLIDNENIPADSHNLTEKPTIEDGESPTKAQKIEIAKVDRHQQRIAISEQNERDTFPNINEIGITRTQF